MMQFQDRIVEEIKLSSPQRRIVYLVNTVDSDNIFKVRHLIERIVDRDEMDNIPMSQRKPIQLRICSPGGVCTDGLNLASFLLSLREKGYIIETFTLGESCSMAFVLACLGSPGHRYAQKHSEFMCHQPLQFKYNYYKLQEDLEDIEHMKRLWERLKKIIIDHTKITMEQLNDITKTKFDWYMWAEEALELGVIDHII